MSVKPVSETGTKGDLVQAALLALNASRPGVGTELSPAVWGAHCQEVPSPL